MRPPLGRARSGRFRLAVGLTAGIAGLAATSSFGRTEVRPYRETEVRPYGQTDARPARSGVEIYFVDVEGGAATLIVSPAGESMLIDSGNPGERDGGRIVHVIREHARLGRVDHYVTTHWHRDHVGGIAEVARAVPVGRFYGHRIPDPLPSDIDKGLIEVWRELAREPVWLAAGDSIPITTQGPVPGLSVDILSADGLVRDEPAGSPQIRSCDRGHEAKGEDASDNARSLGLRVSFGSFDLFAGGDLTWNVEHKLVCPRPQVAAVDAFLVDHHGLDSSNNPVLLEALRPGIVVVNNGPRKGAESQTMGVLLEQLGPTRVFQLHRNVRDGATNTGTELIANEAEDCDAVFIRLTVAPDGERYAVAIPARNRSWSFEVR